MGAAGCQTYKPKPLDLPAHVEAWRQGGVTLSPEAAAVLHDRLEAMGDHAAAPLPDGQPSATATDGDPLTLDLADARAIALRLNPQLRVARAEAGVPAAGVDFADLWPDPQLGFSLKRIAESVDHPWLTGVSLGFSIPLSGRLDAQRALASAQAGEAVQRAVALEARTLRDLELDWQHLASMQRELALLETYGHDVDALAGDAGQLAQAGEITPTDARVFRMQQARTQARIAQMRSHIQGHRLALIERMGLHPTLPVRLAVDAAEADEFDNTVADLAGDELPIDALLTHPEVRIAVAAYEAAEQSLRLEIARQYPDLDIGPTYDREEGQSRIGLGLGIPIPAWNRNQRGIAEAAAARDAARARAQVAIESLVHQTAQARQAYVAARARLNRLETQLAPLVEQQLREVRQLIGRGELDVLLLDAALDKTLNLHQEREAARLALAQAATRLDYLVQPAPQEESP